MLCAWLDAPPRFVRPPSASLPQALTGRELPLRHVRMEQRVATYLLDIAVLCHAMLDEVPSLLAAGAVWFATGMLLGEAVGGGENAPPEEGRAEEGVGGADGGQATRFEPSRLLGKVDCGEVLGYEGGEIVRVARALAALCEDAQGFPALAVHSTPHPLNEGNR